MLNWQYILAGNKCIIINQTKWQM